MHAVRAVRDADKLQNIQYVLFDGAELFSRFSESGEEKIRSEHLNSFMCGEMVEGAPRNKLESVLRVWGWKHDINYE